MSEPTHCSIAVVDIEGSGSLSGPDKLRVRKDLYAMLDEAQLASGITADTVVRREDRGDGVYLLVRADVSIRRLLDPFVRMIDGALQSRTVGEPKLRLRLVVHQGTVTLDENGSSGAAADLTFAMVDSPTVRDALKQSPSGRLVLVVSDETFQGVVRGHEEPDPAAFRMRLLTTKRGPVRTWVTVTGTPDQPGGRNDDIEGPPQRQTTANATVPPFSPQQWVIEKATTNGVMGTNHGGVTFNGPPPRGGEN